MPVTLAEYLRSEKDLLTPILDKDWSIDEKLTELQASMLQTEEQDIPVFYDIYYVSAQDDQQILWGFSLDPKNIGVIVIRSTSLDKGKLIFRKHLSHFGPESADIWLTNDGLLVTTTFLLQEIDEGEYLNHHQLAHAKIAIYRYLLAFSHNAFEETLKLIMANFQAKIEEDRQRWSRHLGH